MEQMSDEASRRARPNVVVILADDLGYSDISCYGSEIQTPYLDRLAVKGVRFTQMYSCARCCPSRASLLTGLYPHQTGIGHMVSDIGIPGYRGFLNEACATMAEVFKANGYRTCLSGKWHVGGRYPISEEAQWNPGAEKRPTPIGRGFDLHYGTLDGAGSYYDPHSLVLNDHFVQPESDDYYYTDAITDFAVSYVNDSSEEPDPFFMYVAYTAPHWPLQAPEEDIEKYRTTYNGGWDAIRTSRHEELKGLGVLDERWSISRRDESAPPWEDVPNKGIDVAKMAVYAAQVDRMDQGIGRIVGALEASGEADNTIIVFLSDNGGSAEFLRENGHREYARTTTRDGRQVFIGDVEGVEPGGPESYMSYGLPWANASNAPFRLFKHWLHEGGIASPCVFYDPRTKPASRIMHEPLHLIDLLPTFLELTGASYPTEIGERELSPLEGESFVDLLHGREWERKNPIFWEHEGNRAVRMGDWKLVSRYPGDWELYNMNDDRTETIDLAERNRPKVEEMARLYTPWADRCNVLEWDEIRKMVGEDFLRR